MTHENLLLAKDNICKRGTWLSGNEYSAKVCDGCQLYGLHCDDFKAMIDKIRCAVKEDKDLITRERVA